MEHIDSINEIVTSILNKLEETECEVSVIYNSERKVYEVLITGENLGHLIGSRGEVSHALQDITNLICRKKFLLEEPVLFDIGGYKKIREEKLVSLAKEVAEKVINSPYPFKLRPMNSYERRIIHTEIAKYPKLVSYSVGEGIDRRIVVEKSEI